MNRGEFNINRKFDNDQVIKEVKSTLQNFFTEDSGWKIFNRYNWVSYIYHLVVQRENENNQIERILVEVNLDDSISSKHISDFNNFTANMIDDNTIIARKVILGIEDEMSVAHSDITYMQLNELINPNYNNNNKGLNKLVA